MSQTGTLEAVRARSDNQASEYEVALEETRRKLAQHGIDTLAVTEDEESLGRKLAADLGSDFEVDDSHESLTDVLDASSRREVNGRNIASILPLQISGAEKPLPLIDGDDTVRVTDAIRQRERIPVARIRMPLPIGHVAMGIVRARA